MSGEQLPVVILSTADFLSDVWTNKQHLAVGLAETREVYYIESLGLREPVISRRDISRIWRRIVRKGKSDPKSSQNAQVPERLKIISPIVVPYHRFRLVRFVNFILLRATVWRKLPNRVTLWTFSPITYGLERRADSIFYHSVDLLHTSAGLPSTLLLERERVLIESADSVIASSRVVKDHLLRMGAPEVNLWENVAQVEIFSDVEVPRKKRAVFAGNLSPHKVDFSLLEELLDSGIELVVAGPRGIDGSTELDGMRRVLDHPRCEYVGNLSIPELARVLPSCMVGLIPYQINDYTNGVFPMKVYEYLAAGLTVVTTPLPSLDQPINGLRIADANTFVDEVESALTGWDEYQSEASRKEAVGHSWTDRVRSANALIDGCAG